MSTQPTIALGPGIALVATHLLLLPTLLVAARFLVVTFFINTLGVLFASTYYHVCQAFDACFFNDPVTIATQFDYFQALSIIATVFIGLTTIGLNRRAHATGILMIAYPMLTEYYYDVEMFVCLTLWFMCQLYNLFLVLTIDVSASLYPPSTTIMVAALAALLKITLIDGTTFFHRSRFRLRFLVPGIVMVLVSLAFFPLSGDTYQWGHIGWHFFAFEGLFFILLGLLGNPVKNRAVSPWREQFVRAAPSARFADHPLPTEPKSD